MRRSGNGIFLFELFKIFYISYIMSWRSYNNVKTEKNPNETKDDFFLVKKCFQVFYELFT